MMKRSLCAIALLAVGVVGCGPSIDLGARPRFANGVNNLTLLVYDGITGASVENATVTVRVGQNLLTADRAGNAYTVAQIPEGTFPVFVEAPSYLGFVATNYFSGWGTLGSTPEQYDTKTVALFPTQSVAEDFAIKVFNSADGTPVSGGRVVVSLESVTDFLDEISAARLSGSFSYRPNAISLPLDSGIAVVSRDQLVFGATYRVDVYDARNAAGDYLSPQVNTATRIANAGFGYPQLNIFMGVVAVSPMALFANNEKGDAVNLENLAVTFPYPVELCQAGAPAATLATVDSNGNATTSALVASGATATATVDGSVVTLTPVFANRDAADELHATFSNVSVQVKGSTTCVALGSVPLRAAACGGGTCVSMTIDMQDYTP